MKKLALFLLLLPLAASAQVAHPPDGFVFADTRVRILGADLGPEVSCDPECGVQLDCPVRVFSDGLEARVHSSHPGQVVVTMPPQPDGTSRTFTLRAPGRPDRTFAFHWTALAVAGEENYLRYLVPVTLETERWSSPWKVFNGSEHLLQVAGATLVILTPPMQSVVGPGETVRMSAFSRTEAGLDGAFVYVPRALDATTTMTLHARERTGAAGSRGAEVPVPRVADFRRVVHLIGIPTDARYRATLRIYGSTYLPTRVTVRTYLSDDLSHEGPPLVGERTVDLAGFVPVQPLEMPEWPAYAQFDPLTPEVRAGVARVRLEVASEGNVPVWAMVSITNNVTQQVTIISPLE